LLIPLRSLRYLLFIACLSYISNFCIRRTCRPPSNGVAFSPDGHRLGVVPAFGNEVTIYDATPLPEKP
jgi:hypothetical protein